jgi:hypothetical protein
MSYLFFKISLLPAIIVAGLISYGITLVLSKAFKFPMIFSKHPDGSRFTAEETKKSFLIFRLIYFPIAFGLIAWLFLNNPY